MTISHSNDNDDNAVNDFHVFHGVAIRAKLKFVGWKHVHFSILFEQMENDDIFRANNCDF